MHTISFVISLFVSLLVCCFVLWLVFYMLPFEKILSTATLKAYLQHNLTSDYHINNIGSITRGKQLVLLPVHPRSPGTILPPGGHPCAFPSIHLITQFCLFYYFFFIAINILYSDSGFLPNTDVTSDASVF